MYTGAGIFAAYTARFGGKGLAKKDMGGLGKSDPFFVIHKVADKKPSGPKQKELPMHKSNVLKNNLNPVWEPFVLDVVKCGGPDQKLKIVVSTLVLCACQLQLASGVFILYVWSITSSARKV